MIGPSLLASEYVKFNNEIEKYECCLLFTFRVIWSFCSNLTLVHNNIMFRKNIPNGESNIRCHLWYLTTKMLDDMAAAVLIFLHSY